jgi:hypothetical protein
MNLIQIMDLGNFLLFFAIFFGNWQHDFLRMADSLFFGNFPLSELYVKC